MNNNRECIVCGEKYFYCFNQTCYDEQPGYMALFHDENCKEIFETLNMEYFGHITAEEATTKMQKLDLSVCNKDTANQKIVKLAKKTANRKQKATKSVAE